MARATNAHINPFLRDDRDMAPGHIGMTRHYEKVAAAENLAASEWPVTAGLPYHFKNIRWNDAAFQPNPNYFGRKAGEDPTMEQRYCNTASMTLRGAEGAPRKFAPAGMFDQAHAGASRGNEMSTMPFQKLFNSQL